MRKLYGFRLICLADSLRKWVFGSEDGDGEVGHFGFWVGIEYGGD